MTSDESSGRTIAIVGSGPEGVAAMINKLLHIADNATPKDPPVKLL